MTDRSSGDSACDDRAISDCGARITELGARLEKWDMREIDVNRLDEELKRIAKERGKEYDDLLDALHGMIDKVCRIYLRGTEAQRARIRQIFVGKQNLMSHLCGYPATVAKFIHTPKDVDRLRVGLAAASIENASLDIRDLILALEDLYRAAAKAGIDPVPHFQETAELSSAEQAAGGFTGSNMRDLLMSFHRRM